MTPCASAAVPLFLLVLCLPSLGEAADTRTTSASASPLWRRNAPQTQQRNVPPAGYYNPHDAGGNLLTIVPGTFPEGLGEPLNVIISGNSDAQILVDTEENGGLQNYFLSFGFSGECLGQKSGLVQGADLGDGDGPKNQTAVMRWNYGDPQLGSCRETIEGGNHFRFWIQDGSNGNSGAIFLAVSYEKPIAEQHDIIENGYNLGRDWLVGNATSNQTIPTPELTNTSTFSGTSLWNGYTYQTEVAYVPGLLQNTSDGINHFITVGMGNNAVDGLVAVMTARITAQPQATVSSSSILASTPSRIVCTLVFALVLPILLSL